MHNCNLMFNLDRIKIHMTAVVFNDTGHFQYKLPIHTTYEVFQEKLHDINDVKFMLKGHQNQFD